MIQNGILVLVCLTAVHLSPAYLLCGALIPKRVALSQITHFCWPELTLVSSGKWLTEFNASSAASLLMAFLNVNPNPSRCQHYVTSDNSLYTEWRFMKNIKYVYLHLHNAATFTAPRASFQELRRLGRSFRCVTNMAFVYNEKHPSFHAEFLDCFQCVDSRMHFRMLFAVNALCAVMYSKF